MGNVVAVLQLYIVCKAKSIAAAAAAQYSNRFCWLLIDNRARVYLAAIYQNVQNRVIYLLL